MLLLLLLNVFECRLKLLHLTKVKVDLGLETMNFSVALVSLVLQTTLPGRVGALSLNLKPNLEIIKQRFECVNAHLIQRRQFTTYNILKTRTRYV